MFMFIYFTVLFATQLAEAWVGCGRQHNNWLPTGIAGRVVHGQDAHEHSWPWIISQRMSWGHFCGGTLLRVKDNVEASDIVLTAAHCVGLDPIKYTGWQVTAGAHWQSYNTYTETRNVVLAKRHYWYTEFTKYDVALLKLDKPIYFTDHIRPVCLPRSGEATPTFKTCVVAGWGRTNGSGGPGAETLQQLQVAAQYDSTCSNLWGATFRPDVAFCAGTLDGTSAACQGDSGGPLVCRESDGSWVQHGVVSYVAGGCSVPNRPPVYSRISAFVDWIQKTTSALTSL